MEGLSVFTKGKSKAVTSPITASRHPLNAPKHTPDGAKRLTGAKDVTASRQKETEKMLDVLAVVKDVMNNWPIRMPNGGMPKPYISNKFGVLTIAFPTGDHVIENSVTSEGKHSFTVDGVPVIPVTSEEIRAESEAE
jgi:hypothetical protein